MVPEYLERAHMFERLASLQRIFRMGKGEPEEPVPETQPQGARPEAQLTSGANEVATSHLTTHQPVGERSQGLLSMFVFHVLLLFIFYPVTRLAGRNIPCCAPALGSDFTAGVYGGAQTSAQAPYRSWSVSRRRQEPHHMQPGAMLPQLSETALDENRRSRAFLAWKHQMWPSVLPLAADARRERPVAVLLRR
jgi:hypothetical protein